MRLESRTLVAALVLAVGTSAQVADEAAVVVAHPQVRDMERTSMVPGSIEPFEVVQLHARVTGYVETIKVDIGDRVSAGQELVQLSVPEMGPELAEARAGVQAARARLEKARADADLATTEARRLTELHTRLPGAVTGQDVDVALAQEQVAAANVTLAEANESVAEAAVARLEVLMTYAVIRAPFDGVVTRRMVDSGALVSAGSEFGTPMLEVMRDDIMRLVMLVSEQVAPLVRQGQALSFTVDALPGRTFDATVARAADSLSPQSRRMRVEADIGRQTGCRPGMYATVALVYDRITAARVVPSRCVRSDGDRSTLLLVEDGIVVEVAVTLIEDDGASSIVTGGGLSADSAVVVLAPADVRVGQHVRVRWEGNPR